MERKKMWGRKRLLHLKAAAAAVAAAAAAAISSSLLLEKSQQVSSTLSDGRTDEPPSGVGQITGVDLSRPQQLLFNNRITQTFQTAI